MGKATILIVEDEAIVAADLAGMLGRLGYGISGTTGLGEEAINHARELRPDLVLMDIRLAGAMDGVEAAEIILREFDLPVIFLTAHSDHVTLERAKLTEPFGYLLKPFEVLGLENHIEMALYKHSAERKLRQAHEELELRVQERTRELMEAEQVLRKINESLEQRVAERTAELQAANASLRESRRAALNMMEDSVAARRRAEETSAELRLAKEEWERTFDSVPDLIALIDRRHRITRVNKAMAQFIGEPAEQCIGQSCFFSVHGNDHPPVLCPHALTMSDDQQHEAEIHGARFGTDLLVTTTPLFDECGRITGTVHVARDITEQKRMQAELRLAHDVLEQRVAERTTELADMVNTLLAEIDVREQAEDALEKTTVELEDLYNFAPCGYHSLDKDGTFVRVNDTELNWLGYNRDEVVGKMKVYDIMTPKSLPVFAKSFPRFKQGNDISDLRLSYIRKNGSILPVLLNASPIMADNGDYLMSRSTIYDITDLVRAEESVRRLNLLYLTLSEAGKAIARLTDRDELFREICRISVENGGFRMAWIGLVDGGSALVKPVASFGSGTDYLENIRITSRPEPEGMGPTGMVIRQGGHFICNDFLSAPCTGPWQAEAGKRGFLASASLAISLHGEIIGALTIYAAEQEYFDPQLVELLVQMQAEISFALDNLDREARQRVTEKALHTEVTERLRVVEALRTQEQLMIQQNRQAAMGEMIGNIAHQWRQPLNTLGLFTQRLGFFYGSPSFNKEFLDSSIAKSMEIIQYMSRTIDDFRNFFSTEREKMEFRVDDAVRRALSLVEAGFKEHRINIEKEEREDIIIHGFPNEYAQVILNIFINARDAITERKIEFPRLKITIGAEKHVSVVTITDNAGGIPEEIIDKIFDPYFTTKGPQQGTGIGLFMSKSIIENNMDGRLTVRNTDDGAEFRIEV